MGFELGRTYSGYEFLGVFKKTSTTVAYRVRNTVAGTTELLYVVPNGEQDDPLKRERFTREMSLRTRLMHPNIPAFLNATELEGHMVMTTELVEGRSLAAMLEEGPLAPQAAAAWTLQILSALACAHEFKIIHRDISPDNIIITSAGVVKLANFGLAKGINSPQLTQAGAVLGDTRYMSPEQARGTGELDSRSDIYSLGAVLYHMLCGRPPFTGKSEFDVMVAHVNEPPKPPSAYNPAVPAVLDSVALKALAKDPAQRYATCVDFAKALDGAPAAPAEPCPVEAPARARGPWLLVGSAAVGLALVLMAVWFMAHA